MGLFYLNGSIGVDEELLVADLGTPASEAETMPKTATTDHTYVLETGKILTWSNTGGTETLEITTGSTAATVAAAQARYNAAGTLQETGTFGTAATATAGTHSLNIPDITWTAPATDDRIALVLRFVVAGHQDVDLVWDVGNTADVMSVGTAEEVAARRIFNL